MKRKLSAAGRLFARVWRDEEGGESVEYGIVLGILAMGAYAAMHGVGAKVVDLWKQLDDALSALG